MIIVSQDKETIINFERITEVVLSRNTISITDNIYKNKGEVIGEYESIERAKEVLQEITEFWKNGAMTDCKGFICFEMPEN